MGCPNEEHRYLRVVAKSGNANWKCLDCKHFLYRSMMLIGRTVRCYNEYCGKKFKVRLEDTERSYLTCGECEELLSTAELNKLLTESNMPADATEPATIPQGDKVKEEAPSPVPLHTLEDIVARALANKE